MTEEQAATELMQLESRHQSGAQWFFWIAALSLLNSGASFFGSDWGFVIGLGITQIFDAAATVLQEQLGGGVRVAAMAASVLVAGLFVLFGVLAGRRSSVAYVVGMLLYALDGLLFLLVGDWLSIGFHVLALVFIGRGFQASLALGARLAAQVPAMPAPSPAEDARFSAPAPPPGP